jgi:hypothetical protein
MTKLSDTQRVILSRAVPHDALLATPPAKLPAASRQAVLRSMNAKGVLKEVPAPREAIALGWRQDEDGALIALRITDAGLRASEIDAADAAPDHRGPAVELLTGATKTADLPTAPRESLTRRFRYPGDVAGGGDPIALAEARARTSAGAPRTSWSRCPPSPAAAASSESISPVTSGASSCPAPDAARCGGLLLLARRSRGDAPPTARP